MMDAQTRARLEGIETIHILNKQRAGLDYVDYVGGDYEFLLRLVHEQELQLANHDKIIEWNHRWEAENNRLQAQLAKYERVVEAAQHWRETRKGGVWRMKGGAKEMVDMLQVEMAREQALITAIDALDGDAPR